MMVSFPNQRILATGELAQSGSISKKRGLAKVPPALTEICLSLAGLPAALQRLFATDRPSPCEPSLRTDSALSFKEIHAFPPNW